MSLDDKMPAIDRSNEFPPMTDAEWDVYDALSVAFNRFVALPVLHPNDQGDFANAVNVLKNLVMSRPVARLMAERGWSGYVKPGVTE